MRLKISLVVTREYDINPDFYPPGATAAEILELDMAAVRDDRWMFFDLDGVQYDTTGTILEE